ncbi:hypothetical protein V0M98_32255 (plasmid) [Pseudomonas silesiensis]|uniref:hypothetical protein n=1 Tax=Pseudomonas silesiensis TaxID=1853130 RepID=UPI0030CC6A17
MDMAYVNKQLGCLCESLDRVQLEVSEIKARTAIPDNTTPETKLFSVRVKNGGSRYGVTMMGQGLISLLDYSADIPRVIRRVSVTQAVDILLALTQNNLFVHLEEKLAA